MSSIKKLYILLLVAALCLQVACDDGETTPAADGGTNNPTGGSVAMGGADDPSGGTDPNGDTGGTVAGGADDGGTVAGGADDGGAVAGGADDGGAVAGGADDGGTEIVGPGNTDPVTCEGDYCPSARLSSIILPATIAEATMGNCNVQGSNNGSGLGQLLTSLAAFIGEINPTEFVEPDENGEISLILLNHLSGWENGQTGNDAGELISNFYTGEQNDDDSFSIATSSLDANGDAQISFEGTTVTDGLLRAGPSDFVLDLPVVEGLPIRLVLNQSDIIGKVSVDENGFNLKEGTLAGYLTQDSIDELIGAIVDACTGTPPEAVAELCSGLDSIGGPEAAAGILQSVLTYDSTVSADGSVASCPAGTPACNAISVCILLEMDSASVTGIAAE